jgi:hypothetical protein
VVEPTGAGVEAEAAAVVDAGAQRAGRRSKFLSKILSFFLLKYLLDTFKVN